MNNLKWEEGKTYQLKRDMAVDFCNANSSNSRIFGVIGMLPFTVKSLSGVTVVELAEYDLNAIRLTAWFTSSEIKYFELVEDITEEPNMTNTNNIRPIADIVVEWLDKLTYVLQVDQSVADNLTVTPAGIVLDADYGSIYGATSVYNFITNRYDLLQQEAKHKKNNELMERKAKLEAELAEVNMELGEVK